MARDVSVLIPSLGFMDKRPNVFQTDTIIQRGLPFSEYFSHVDEKRGFPLRSTVLAICFCSLYGLIYLGSSNAFNSIVTSAVLYLVSFDLLF
jgi:amino acid transporter